MATRPGPDSLALCVAFGLLLSPGASEADSLSSWMVVGPAPDRYQIQADAREAHGGRFSASIRRDVEDWDTFAGLTQAIRADRYRGKRLRLSAYLKSADVQNWSGIWMRVDGSRMTSLAFDNMHDRAVTGTTPWTRYDVVLDVPEGSVKIAFGVLLARKGQLWVDDVTFEVVGPEVPTTDLVPETNTLWFENLLSAALNARVRRIILISFPHVEGDTSVDLPATGRLDRSPTSVHARTRLQEEQALLTRTRGTDTSPVVLRLGMVYGRGILMIEAARWLARRRLLAVWREPTWIHVVSTIDCLNAIEGAVSRDDVEGIYHVGDEKPVTLQSFLDSACTVWGYPRPTRLPLWLIYTAAYLCELFATVARTPAPLTRDFIRIGRVSYWGDTRRTRADLLADLEHPTLEEGLSTLR